VEEEKHLTEELYHQLAREDASVGPVAQALRFLVRSRSKLSGQSLEGLFNKTAEGVAKDKTADLFKATARIDSEILLALRGTAAAKRLREPEVMLKEAMGQAFRMFAAQVEKKKRSLAGRFSAWRRLWQRCVLCVPAALLVLKLAGWDRIESWLESPSFLGALKLVLALLTSLFGPEGLVGLTALLICEILLILYLAARRNTRIRRMARQLALQGIGFSEAATDSAARSLEAERLETIRTVGKGMEDLKSLAVLFGLQRSLPGAD
jgi:hypothetical protein